MDADKRKALRAKANAILRNEGDVRAYSIAVSPAMRDFLALGLPSVVVELLDALEAAELANESLKSDMYQADDHAASRENHLRAERDELAAEVAELLGDIATLADFVDDEISNDARCPMCGRKGRHENDCHYVTLAARARRLL